MLSAGDQNERNRCSLLPFVERNDTALCVGDGGGEKLQLQGHSLIYSLWLKDFLISPGVTGLSKNGSAEAVGGPLVQGLT